MLVNRGKHKLMFKAFYLILLKCKNTEIWQRVVYSLEDIILRANVHKSIQYFMLLKENILWFELYTQVFECLYLMNINFVLMLLKIRRQLWLNSIQLSICNFKLLFFADKTCGYVKLWGQYWCDWVSSTRRICQVLYLW